MRIIQILDPHPGLVHPVLRQVNPVQLPVIILAVLHMIYHLQTHAQRIRRPIAVTRPTVQVEQVTPDRGRRQFAIPHQVGPVPVSGLHRIEFEGGQQINAMTGLDAGLQQAVAHVGGFLISRYIRRLPKNNIFKDIQAGYFVFR